MVAENSTRSGQLHSALAAMERWLYDLIDAGSDVTAHIEHLLRTSNSVAILHVCVNVGKYRPELFSGPLKPVLALHQSYLREYPARARERLFVQALCVGAWWRNRL